jgi:hypothetical protein
MLRLTLVLRPAVIRDVEAFRRPGFLPARFAGLEALAEPARRLADDFAADLLAADLLAADLAVLRVADLPTVRLLPPVAVFFLLAEADFVRLVEAALAAASFRLMAGALGLFLELVFVAFVRPVAIITSFALQQVGRGFQPAHRA